MRVFLLLFGVLAIWINERTVRALQITDETPKLVSVRLNLDDEEFKRLDDEEFEKHLLETLMTTLTKSTSYNRNLDNEGMNPPEQPPDDEPSLDSWSVVWYIASFGGLIAFFLIISCSEWCCRKGRSPGSAYPRSSTSPAPSIVPETPPPSYDHFAPPSYDSLTAHSPEKGAFDVYVVPVHALRPIMEGDAPPSYNVTNERERSTTTA